MRIKIPEKPHIPHLQFGQCYEIHVTTCAWSYRFKFTRKRNLHLTEINRGCHGSPDMPITKKALKRLINDQVFTERVTEADFSQDILYALFHDLLEPEQLKQAIHQNKYRVLMSRLYDMPSQITVQTIPLSTLLNDLQHVELVVNNISAIQVDGTFRPCVSLSLIGDYKQINGEPVRSLYILLDTIQETKV